MGTFAGNGGLVRLYINGELIAEGVATSPYDETDTQLFIGIEVTSTPNDEFWVILDDKQGSGILVTVKLQ